MRAFVAPASCAALISLSTPASATESDPWFGRDKFLHFGASAVLAAGGYGVGSLVLDEPWQRAVAGAGFSLTLGAAKELVDLTGAGNASARDLVWDAAGTAIGIGLALAIDALTGTDGPTRPESQEAALVVARF